MKRLASGIIIGVAMAPIVVDWDQSDLSRDGHIVVRNVNRGGNPVSGVTVKGDTPWGPKEHLLIR